MEAAARTFTAPPSLSLDPDGATEGGAIMGRRRLTGAFFIDIARIRPDATQPRRIFDADAKRELLASVRQLGILQPISVRYLQTEDVYQIISGQRRYEAALAAGLSELPSWVQTPDGREILLQQIAENWQRANLHPFELADALAQLRDANGWPQKKLAEETGKPEAEISKLLKLLELAPDIQKEARNDASGSLSFRHLYNIARLEPSTQAVIATAVREQGLSAVETERLVKKEIDRRKGIARRGSPVTKVEYLTAKAKVVLTFRRQAIDRSDILAALDEARAKAEGNSGDLNIVRPK